MTYWYCSVKIKGISQLYSYISDAGKLTEGSYVEVPFGAGNTPRIGVVKACAEYESGHTPYPPMMTKHITREATLEEYKQTASLSPFGDDDDEEDDDFFEAECYIDEEDWDALLEWACDRHNSTDPATLKMLVHCYSICVEHDMPIAALNLGSLYYNGRGVEQDYSKAFELYQIAANAGELRAICNLGYCYYYGRDQAVNYEKAYQYFELGALLYNDSNCLYKLGDMYLSGYHVEKNSIFAFKLYDRALKSAEEINDECLADVQFRIGKCLLRSIGVDRNIELANTFLHTALLNFYKRRKTDPFVAGLIQSTKECIREAEALLDTDLMSE